MQERPIKVRNRAGIHCRPSGVILNAIREEFPGHRFSIVTAEGATEIDSMLELISRCLTCGAEAVLRVEGPEEERAIRRIGDLFEYEFDFPPRAET